MESFTGKMEHVNKGLDSIESLSLNKGLNESFNLLDYKSYCRGGKSGFDQILL